MASRAAAKPAEVPLKPARTASPAPKEKNETGAVGGAQAQAAKGTQGSRGKERQEQIATFAAVAFWFIFNISLSTLTKWTFLFGEVCTSAEGCKQFRFPLTLTAVHMLFSWAMCRIYIAVDGRSRGPWLTASEQIRKIVPLATCFAASVAMGNQSLKYIYPSFNQMLGSMSPLITVLMSIALLQKQYNTWTWISMPVLCGGLALCSVHEVHFHIVGGLFATGATVLRGAKSIIQGKLLDKGAKIDSVALLCYMAPWSAFLLLGVAAFTEGFEPFVLLTPGSEKTGVFRVWGLLVVGGLTACLLNLTNFLVTSYTSAVTLQVLGNVKCCLSIAVSVAVFRNPLHIIQGVGVAICLFGVGLYNRYGGPVQKLSDKGAGVKAQ